MNTRFTQTRLWGQQFVLFFLFHLFCTTINLAQVLTLDCSNLPTTVNCRDITDTSILPQVMNVGDCPNGTNVTLIRVDDPSGLDDCGNSGTILRTWTATDLCGNTATCVQTISLTNEAPVLDCRNLDITISCKESRSENDLPKPTVSDDCTGLNALNLTFADDESNLASCGQEGVILRTWTATDECGNTASCIQTITIVNQAPTIDCSNLDVAITCNQNIANLKAPTVTDDCTVLENIELSYVDDNSNVAPCGVQGNILRTWTATDACGLTATCVQVISIINRPLVANCNLATTNYKCERATNLRELLIEWDAGNLSFLERCANFGCDNPVTVTSSFDPNLINETCETTSETSVTYIVRDNCGRETVKVGKYTVLNPFNPLCDQVDVQSFDNQIIIDQLVAPNVITKLFDKDYSLVFECVGDCSETETIDNLNVEEIYHTDVQFYDENWQFICEAKQDVQVTGENQPCDPSICEGDVVLSTQAEVDAFCGCEKITGALVIGDPNGNNLSDITSLANLKGLKQVDSTIIIGGTTIETLGGLEEVTTIGSSLVIGFNPFLKNLDGLVALTKIEQAINLGANPVLADINGLRNLKEISTILMSACPIKDLTVFSNLEVTNLSELSLTGMSQLASLNGLENIESINIVGSEVERGKMLLGGNPVLKDIAALKNLRTVVSLIIDQNASLSDCCSISHLVDDDPNNGNANRVVITNNPSFCNSIQEIVANCQVPVTACEMIQISTSGNQIVLSGLFAPNVIAKLFDEQYQIIFNCAGDCAEMETIPNLTNGIYHTDIQFYDENWQFICEDKQDITVTGGNEPCDTTICQGDIYFSSQAEIDAFCGCEVIQGNLIIAGIPNGGLTGELTDVVSLAKFSGLKRIEGTFTIVESQIADYSGLDDLKYVGDGFAAVNNNLLTSFKGLEQVERINRNVAILGNPQLIDVSNFEHLSYVGTQLFISNNNSLSKIEGFSSLIALGENDNFQDAKSLGINENADLVEISAFNQLSTVFQLSVNTNPNLIEINGFEQLKEVQKLVIARNNELVDIGLAALTTIGNSLNVTGNSVLEACCILIPFLDGENPDGTPIEFINVSNNKGDCASVEAILTTCQTPSKPSCRAIEIQTTNTQITISNLNAPIEILKIFDKDYRIIYECFADCEETITVADLSTGTYHLGVNFYDENWKDICELIETIHVGDENRTQDRNTTLAAKDFKLAPNPALTVTFVDLSQLKDHPVKLQLVNQFGQAVWSKNIEKVTTTPTKIELTDISNGLYFLQIQAKGRRVIAKKLLVNRLY